MTVVKGAAETVLDRCKTAYSDNGAVHSLGNLAPLHKEIDMLSTAGVRVIAIATAADSLPEGSQEMPNNLTLVGFVGLRDEVRAEARNAVEILQRAGIQVRFFLFRERRPLTWLGCHDHRRSQGDGYFHCP